MNEYTIQNLMNLNPALFRAQRVELPRETVLPGYSPVTLTATVKGVALDVTTLKKNAPTAR